MLQTGTDARVGVQDRRHPVIPRRPIRALRQPHPPTGRTHVPAAVGGSAGHLGPQRLIVQQQRHVGVRRVAGQDLDMPFAITRSELPRDVAADALEVLQRSAIERFPSVRHLDEMPLPPRRERDRILPRDIKHSVQVADKPRLEPFVCQLLEQDRCEADGQARPCIVQGGRTDQVEQRQIDLGGSLVEPRFPVRKRPMVQNVGQVAVQDQAEGTDRLGHPQIVTARPRASYERGVVAQGRRRGRGSLATGVIEHTGAETGVGRGSPRRITRWRGEPHATFRRAILIR